ncbi:MAG: M20 aminoacylase family protein [Burkholderiaceae bacterium]
MSAADILERARERADEFVALRRDIHGEPELAFQETRTAALVAERLRAWGYEVDAGLGGTGVVGTLRRGTGSKRLGIRADMDALPIVEDTGLAYASKRRGVMHACGHDGHTAMLLAAACQLAAHGRFSGTLNLIFQPAEEGQGGAAKMIEAGLFERHPCDAVFGMHNAPGYPQGQLLFRDGPMTASSDYAKITLRGVGGHGAFPHRAADPIVAASSLVMALQTIVSRNVDPIQSAVVSVGTLQAGVASNVIPASATMELSIRAFDDGVRDLLETRIRELAAQQAASFGVRAEVDYQRRYAVLVNTRAETDFARQVGIELVGAGRCVMQHDPVTGSEDFSFMLQKVPGCFLMIGNGDGDSPGATMCHHPGYDFNDANLPLGAAYWVLLAERFLQGGGAV